VWLPSASLGASAAAFAGVFSSVYYCTPASVERCQSAALVARDLAAAVGGALEGLVVTHHQHAVFGQVQVQFHTIDAGLQCPAEARERVLRCLAARAAMSVDQHAFQSLRRFS
jgi:hypothetical protein